MIDDPFERAVEQVEAAAEREDAERRQREQERRSRGQRLGFRIHATVFVAVQLTLVAIWALVWATTGASYPWFIYPLLAWGIGLAAHYAVVRDHLDRANQLRNRAELHARPMTRRGKVPAVPRFRPWRAVRGRRSGLRGAGAACPRPGSRRDHRAEPPRGRNPRCGSAHSR